MHTTKKIRAQDPKLKAVSKLSHINDLKSFELQVTTSIETQCRPPPSRQLTFVMTVNHQSQSQNVFNNILVGVTIHIKDRRKNRNLHFIPRRYNSNLSN